MDSLSYKSKIIMGPIITSWFYFILNFVPFYLVFKDDYNLDVGPIIPFIIIVIFEFGLSILVTLSFEMNKYFLYLGGVILCLISNLILLIYLIILCKKGREWTPIIISPLEWIEFAVLIIYNNKVKASLDDTS